MKILIVDDDAGTLNALNACLSSFDHRVIVAGEGDKALEIIEASGHTEPIDLVITDLKMPGMNGLDLIRAVRKEKPSLACILMTAYGNDVIRKEVGMLGSCGYIEKPFLPEKLLKSINNLKR